MFNKSSIYDFRRPGVSPGYLHLPSPWRAWPHPLRCISLSPCNSIKCLGQPWKYLVTPSKKQEVPLFYVPLGPGGRGVVEPLHKPRSPRQHGFRVKVQDESVPERRSREPGECASQAENMSTFIVCSSVALLVRTPWVPAQAPVRCHGLYKLHS